MTVEKDQRKGFELDVRDGRKGVASPLLILDQVPRGTDE